MANQNVILLGATGETGASILTGLLTLGNFVSHPSQFSEAYRLTARNRKSQL